MDERMLATLDKLNRVTPDCGDNSCHFAVSKSGMRTNGGCRCLNERSLMKSPMIEQYAYVARFLIAEAIPQLQSAEALIEELEGALKAVAFLDDKGVIKRALRVSDARAKYEEWKERRCRFTDLNGCFGCWA